MEKAKWIRSTKILNNNVNCFKHKVFIENEIKKITLDISAMGFYRVYINNKDITDKLFMPGYTAFSKRVQLFKYDLTNYFNKGENIIEIHLANGWGGVSKFGWLSNLYPYFKQAIIYEFKFETFDSSFMIYSDENVDVYNSFVIFSDLYNGEIQDRLVDEEYYGKAILADDISSKLISQEGEDIIEGEVLKPLKMFYTPKNELVIDFGQNFAGIIKIKIKGNKGDKISFVPGEILDKNGNFYRENYREAETFYQFTLTGNDDEFKPIFSFIGLRYIKLIEYPKNIDISNFEGVLVHSNIKRTCYFKTGNEKINRLYKNVIYGQLSNFIDIPTDCPQRNEKLGWTGDAQVFAKTAAINFNVKNFFAKWLNDMMIEQDEDGRIECVIPKLGGLDTGRSSGWGDASVIVPYEIYKAYGDKSLLLKHFSMMQKWVDYIEGQCYEKPFIWNTGFHYGDWVASDAPKGFNNGKTSIPLIATAFFAHSTELLVNSGHILNINVTKYEILLENIKKAFQNEFIVDGLPKKDNIIYNDIPQTCFTQTAIALILRFDLCKKEDKAKMADMLEKMIIDNGGSKSTGFLGTPYILHALSENGKDKCAYDLLFSEKNPSWLYQVNKGATTMWEHWDGIKENGDLCNPEMNSFNHYAYGAVFDWMFENCGGIKNIECAYNNIIIRPLIDKRLGYVELSYSNDEKEIDVRWDIVDENIFYKINIKGIKDAKFIYKNGIEISLKNGLNTLSEPLN